MTSTPNVSSTTPPQDMITTELNMRVINPGRDPGRGRVLGTLLSGFIYRAEDQQTIIEEIIRDGQVEEMRICLLYKTSDVLAPTDLRRYSMVNRLEVSVPAPCISIFDWTSCLPVLKLVRLGSGFFGECKEMPLKKMERSPSVTDLIINFDKQKYDNLQKTEQSRLQNKLDNLLDLASKQLVNLSFVDLVLPSGEALNTFLNKCPSLKFNGEKTENYALGMVTFRTIRSQTSHTKAGPLLRRPHDHANHKVKRARTGPSVEVLSPQEHFPDPGSPPIQVVNLAESDSDGDKTPPRVAAEAVPVPPVVSEPPRDPRLGGVFYNRGNRRGGNGRGSPSLLG